jgi:hypothetical protein
MPMGGDIVREKMARVLLTGSTLIPAYLKTVR